MSEEKIYIITRDIEDYDVCDESFWKEEPKEEKEAPKKAEDKK